MNTNTSCERKYKDLQNERHNPMISNSGYQYIIMHCNYSNALSTSTLGTRAVDVFITKANALYSPCLMVYGGGFMRVRKKDTL